MSKIFKASLIIMIVFCINAYANAPVWKVSKAGNHIYIGGTMHVLSKDDYPLKSEFKQALVNSDEVIFEADLSQAQTPKFQGFIFENSRYQNGKTIKDFLSNDTYMKLATYLQTKRMPKGILQMKPGFILSTISMIIYTEAGFRAQGVDAYMEKEAILKNKKVSYLESLEEQIGFVSTMGVGNEESFIKMTLEDINEASVQIPLMHKAWKNGDTKLLAKEITEEFKKDFPKAYEILIVNRNNNWVKKIEKMFDTKSVEYVLVGFAHLAGSDSVLKKLEALGYKIQRVRLTH